MDRLSSDRRTASLGGDKPTRRLLSRYADQLFEELGTRESATWVASSGDTMPSLLVLTTERLLMLPLVSGQPTRTIRAPFLVQLGDKRLLGQSVSIVDAQGARSSHHLGHTDLAQIQRAEAHFANASWNRESDNVSPAQRLDAAAQNWTYGDRDFSRPHSYTEPAGAVPGTVGAWRWGQPLLGWQDAERMAAAHVAHLGFTGARVTPPGRDGGLDVIANGAAAQVKHHSSPTGGPHIQQLRGAAEMFASRLFYATAYTPAALFEGDRLNVALFQFTVEGFVTPVNAVGRKVSPPPLPYERGPFGGLTFESRQNRAVRWAQQIEDATRTPISNRKRKGARQLIERQQALALMIQGLAQLNDSSNPLYKLRRKERTLEGAEKTLKKAGRILGIVVR